ncbi:MAG: MerR family transcriptional regulator [Deltaproteobacteria bacterium]
MSVDSSMPIYPISVAAKLLSVHPRTLRIYEEEGLIKPSRQGNKRYFSNDDIEWIRCLRMLIHERGISIPGIKMLLELTPCWEITKCPEEKRNECFAYKDRSIPCWEWDKSPSAMQKCEKCGAYIKAMKAAEKEARKEAGQMADPETPVRKANP